MRTCYQGIASHGVIRPRFAEKVYFILLFAHFVLVHVIKRISNEFSFHTMYYETRCVFYIPSPEARGYKTHNSFHNTSYGMKIHLRSYIYTTKHHSRYNKQGKPCCKNFLTFPLDNYNVTPFSRHHVPQTKPFNIIQIVIKTLFTLHKNNIAFGR